MKLPLRSFTMSRAFASINKCFSYSEKTLGIKSNIVLSQRCFHASNQIYFWEPNKKGSSEYLREIDQSKREHFKRGVKLIIPETKKWFGELKDAFSQDAQKHLFPQEGVIDKYFEFNGPQSLENWVCTSDSDWDGGYSTADCKISPSGTGIFYGNLCTQKPKTGKISVSGYTNIRFVPPTKSFLRDHTYVFVAYTHLAVRVRGDGRTYMLNIHPHTFFDSQWLDVHSYVLHTRGGPYWQETVVPFSKFYIHHRGRIHDDQYPIDLQEVKSFSISCMDQNDGPYQLEIDYVGCMRDENHTERFVYEQYYVPRFTGKN